MSKTIPKGKPVALTQSKSAKKTADTTTSNSKADSSLAGQQVGNQQDKKRVLVVDKNDRDAQARELADAWGLTRATESDDEEESIRGGSDNEQVDRKAGLGATTAGRNNKVDEKSLEYKLERARQKQKKDAMNRSVELSIWNTGENEDEDAEEEDTKSKLAKTKKKPRIARVYDNVPDVAQQSSSANSAKKKKNKAANSTTESS